MYKIKIGEVLISVMFEGLSKYLSIVLDYSVILEYSSTAAIDELFNIIDEGGMDIYVSDTFKLFHYIVVEQQVPKDKNAQSTMKSMMQRLLRSERLHLVHTCNTEEFIEKVNNLNDSCILTTRRSVFAKRLYEKAPVFNGDVAIVSNKDGLMIFSSIEQMIEEYPLPAISKLAHNNTFLDSGSSPNFGDVVTANTGEKFTLEKRLSGGAEGMVFTTDNPKYVAKIYHKGVITPLRWAKLNKLAEIGITTAEFCVPQHLLFYHGSPVGYTMFMGKGTTLSNVFDGPDALFERFPDWTRKDVVDTLYSLIGKYIYLHMHNVIAGDIQLKNALIYSSTCQYLIDMDSVQVAIYPCPVGTEDFTDPRLWGRDFSSFTRKLKDEDYSIAMLVFSILFCGLHPYATRNGAETLREEILNRNFPYTLDNSDTEHIPLGGYNHIWEYLPDRLRIMLYNTFREGKSYEAVEWRDAVQEYKNELDKFAYDDIEAYKVFPCENYKQRTVNIAEGRAKYEQRKALDQKRSEPRPVYEKKVFNNVPSGRYVSSSVGNNAFKPFKSPEDNAESKAPAPAPNPAPQPFAMPNNNAADTAKKNKKFFGLF